MKKLLSVGLVSILLLTGCAPKESSSTSENNIVGTISDETSFSIDPTAENVF